MNATNLALHGGIALVSGLGAGLVSYGAIQTSERHPDETALALATNVGIPLTTAASFGALLTSVSRGSTLGAAASGAALLGTLVGGMTTAFV